MSDVKLDMKLLTNFRKALLSANTTIRVGIMGAEAATPHPVPAGQKAPKTLLTNAEVGAFHELDGKRTKLPRRSFLQVPLAENFEKKLGRSIAGKADFMKKVLESGTFTAYFDVMEVVALAVVEEAFDTSGYGKWPSSDMSKKKVHQTLVESGALRESIDTKQVKGNG